MNTLLDPTFRAEETQAEIALRPPKLNDFQGQKKVVENLSIFIQAANLRGDALDHVLLHGPPGLGKTTLAYIIAREMGASIKTTSGPVIEKPGDLAGLLSSLNSRDILFIDEIHRLSPVVEEYLYSAMEDYKIDIMIESGPNARTIQIEINPFTLIGATTRSGLLTSPMRARFGISSRLEYYDEKTLAGIVIRSADLMKVQIAEEAALEIARRSRGTPRISNALLRRVRDFAQVLSDGYISLEVAKKSLKSLNIDKNGLDDMDNNILQAIAQKFSGGPVGVSSLSMSVSEEVGTIEEVYEPFLIKEGYIVRTPRGREITDKGCRHIGISPTHKKEKGLDSGLF